MNLLGQDAAVGDGLGRDFSGSRQGNLGQDGAYQLVDQHGEEDDAAHDGTLGTEVCGDGGGHTQSHTGLGQQGDAQVFAHGLGAANHPGADTGTDDLAGGTHEDIHQTNAHDSGTAEDPQVQLCTGQHEEQNVNGGGPAVGPVHDLVGEVTQVAEDGAAHHAHQQGGEADLYAVAKGQLNLGEGGA